MPSGYVYSWVSGSANFNASKSWYNSTSGTAATAVPSTNDEALVVASGNIKGPGSVYLLGLTGTGNGLLASGPLVGTYAYVGGTVSLASGAELYSPNLIDIGDNSANTIAGRVPSTLTVGQGSTVYASLGTPQGFDILVGQYGGSGTLAVAGGVAASGQDGFYVGNNGTGLLSVTNGGIAFGGFGSGVSPQQIGLALGIAGGTGTLAVSGQSSAAEFGDIVEVGFGGSGLLSVGAGSVLDAGNGTTSVSIGDTSSGIKGSGTLAISGGQAVLSGLIDDGANGYGHMSLSNGAVVASYVNAGTGSAPSFSAILGANTGTSGTLSIASQSEMIAQYGLAVGSEGNGELDVSSATLTINAPPAAGAVALEAGAGAGSSGLVTVSGGTIIDTAAAGMIIGGSGGGTLAITQVGTQGGEVLTGDPTTGTGLAIAVSTGSSGIVSVSGSASGLGVYGAVSDGGAGVGSLDLSNFGRLVAGLSDSTTGLVLGGTGGVGLMSVGSYAQALIFGQTDVGESGAGSLSIVGGSSFTGIATGNAAMIVGVSAGVTGLVFISDPSTYVPLTGGLVVGDAGTGSVSVQNTAQVFVTGIATPGTPGVILGAASGGVGTLSLASQALLSASNGVAVGSEGAGELDVSSGATLVVHAVPAVGVTAVDAGVSSGASGTINVAGGTILDPQSAGMILGASGTGTLNITELNGQGGQVLTGNPTGTSGLALGVSAGSSGVVSVAGAASGLGVYGTVVDGSSGTGAIALTNGASLVAGAAPTATGLVLANGGGAGSLSLSTGALANVVGQTDVGESGSGTLLVTGGSSFTGTANDLPALVVGGSTGGTGSVLVSGASTNVNLSGGLVVGDAGTGSLDVTAGGLVSVTGTVEDNGQILLNGGTLSFLGDLGGSGALTVSGGGLLALGSGAAENSAIAFGAGGGTVTAGTSADLLGTLSGWSAGDFVSLTNIVAASESFANGTLSLFDTSSQLVGKLAFGGALTSDNFTLTQAGAGTIIGYHA